MADPSNGEAGCGSLAARDGAAIAATALLLGVLLSTGLSPIIAGAGFPILLFIIIIIVAWPAAMMARARGHHGIMRAGLWGGGLAAPLALFALLSGSYAETIRSLGLGVGGGVLAWLLVKVQALVVAPVSQRYCAAGRYVVAALLGAGVLAGMAAILAPRPQPDSARTVAAFEVLLPTPEERAEFLAVLEEAAEREGLHMDAAAAPAQPSKSAPMTVYASVWRGDGDDESLASVMDVSGSLDRAWITFSRGKDPGLATRFREHAMAQVRERWPSTRSLPIAPTGAIPLPQDLRRTPDGYRVVPSAASRYGLPPTSPLVASN